MKEANMKSSGKHVVVVGAGNVGSCVARAIAEAGIVSKLSMIDSGEGIAEGKALDISHSLSLTDSGTIVEGSVDYSCCEGFDIAVITAGKPRTPGMSRSDLLSVNAGIVKETCGKLMPLSNNPVIVMVTNPLDEMVYLANKETKLDRHRILGMAGMLDSARFRYAIAKRLGLRSGDVSAAVLGRHGDGMVPLVSSACVSGLGIRSLMTESEIEESVNETRDAGADVVKLLGSGSAYFAPGLSTYQTVRAIALNEKRIMPCCVKLEGEMGYMDICMGVPVLVSSAGWEKVIEVEMDTEEQSLLSKCADQIAKGIEELNGIL